MKIRALPLLIFLFALLLGHSAGAANLAERDRAFLEQAAQNGHAEVSAAHLALTKARHPQVREFAQRMLDDHTRVGQELETLATSRSFATPKEPSVRQKSKEMVIATVGDDSFDRRYLNQMGIEAHESAVALFEKAGRESRDPEVKAFVSKHLPGLRQHLQAARDLLPTVDPDHQPPRR